MKEHSTTNDDAYDMKTTIWNKALDSIIESTERDLNVDTSTIERIKRIIDKNRTATK